MATVKTQTMTDLPRTIGLLFTTIGAMLIGQTVPQLSIVEWVGIAAGIATVASAAHGIFRREFPKDKDD